MGRNLDGVEVRIETLRVKDIICILPDTVEEICGRRNLVLHVPESIEDCLDLHA